MLRKLILPQGGGGGKPWELKFSEDWGYGEPPTMSSIFTEDWQYGDPIGLELKFSEDWNYSEPPSLSLIFTEAWSS